MINAPVNCPDTVNAPSTFDAAVMFRPSVLITVESSDLNVPEKCTSSFIVMPVESPDEIVLVSMVSTLSAPDILTPSAI